MPKKVPDDSKIDSIINDYVNYALEINAYRLYYLIR